MFDQGALLDYLLWLIIKVIAPALDDPKIAAIAFLGPSVLAGIWSVFAWLYWRNPSGLPFCDKCPIMHKVTGEGHNVHSGEEGK